MQLNTKVYKELGLPTSPVGSLVVAWNEQELQALPDIVQANHILGKLGRCILKHLQVLHLYCTFIAGDFDVKQLSVEELYIMEPKLSPTATGAVFIPGEVIVEPWLVPIAYSHHGLQNGGQILFDHEIVDGKLESSKDSHKMWRLVCSNKSHITARAVINCAGNFADIVEKIHVPNPTFQV